jgi:hypothetical protein
MTYFNQIIIMNFQNKRRVSNFKISFFSLSLRNMSLPHNVTAGAIQAIVAGATPKNPIFQVMAVQQA